MGKTYIETFDSGAGGWTGWHSNARGAQALEITDGVVISRSPWWIDYNHAPPGGGYLHLLFCQYTAGYAGSYEAIGGPNRFVRGGFPTDFTGAKLTARLTEGWSRAVPSSCFWPNPGSEASTSTMC